MSEHGIQIGGSAPRPIELRDVFFLSILSLITAMIGASVVVSLIASLRFVGPNGADASAWEVLNNIGGFWNGHFGAVSLVAVAWGLFLQLRAVQKEARTEQAEAVRAQAEIRRWVLTQMDERRQDQARWLRGTLVWQDSGVWKSGVYHGQEVVAVGMAQHARLLSEGSEGCRFRAQTEELRRYLKIMEGSAAWIERAPEDEREVLRHAFDYASEQEHLTRYLADFDALPVRTRKLVAGWLRIGVHELPREVAAAIELGWEFDLHDYNDQQVLVATRVTLDGHVLSCGSVANATSVNSTKTQLLGVVESIRTGEVETVYKRTE